MKRLLIIIGIVLLPILASAQATGTSKLAFDQAAANLAEANSLTYKYYPDGAATGVTTTVTCTGSTSPFVCETPFPAFTPGSHTIQVTASNAAGESLKSAVFNFTFVVIPSAPVNLRIR